MISNEIVRLVFEYSNIEGCVALSQVNTEFFDVWSDLDSSLVRERVLERAPWFSLDEECGLDSWRKCALLLVRRSSRALERSEGSRHLYTIRNLTLPVNLCCNKVQFGESVDFSKDNGVRETMDPLFSELYAALDQDNIFTENIEGTKLLLQPPGVQLDFKTMQVSEEKHLGLQSRYVSWPFVTSPSGLTILNPHPGQRFKVLGENDSLLLLVMEKSTVLIHKASHPRDESGAYVLSESHDDTLKKSETMLLPGCGGALKLSYHTGPHQSRYLTYVEPSPGLPEVLVCQLPRTSLVRGRIFDVKSPLFTTYNGYLYLYFGGRFIRLWVDLGIRSKLKKDDELASEGLRGHALTVWDRRFPAIGSFGSDLEIDGSEILRNGRFVTLSGACGLVVGDLKTGTTQFNDKGVLSIPFADGDGVGFYTVDNWVYKKVKEKLSKGLLPGEENLTTWWNEACVPQVVRGGDPVFTRVVRAEHVTDDPVSFEDGELFEEEPDPGYAQVYRDTEIYKDRPPLHRSALVHTLFEHFEDHELPLEEYFQS